MLVRSQRRFNEVTQRKEKTLNVDPIITHDVKYSAQKSPQSPMCASALAYARRGWRVIPIWPFRGIGHTAVCCCPQKCDNPGKHPFSTHAASDASADPEVIRRWFEDQPEAGIGLHMGLNGISCLDSDPRNGGDFQALQHDHGELDWTCVQASGRGDGGQHVLMRAPDESLGAPGKPGSGFDYLCGNKIIVVEPSPHFASGLRYKWSSKVNPSNTHKDELLRLLSNPPTWLFEKSKSKESAKEKFSQPAADRVPVDRITAMAVDKVRSGEDTRNNTGYWFFCQLRDNGYSKDEASLTLREWVRLANEATLGQVRYTQEEAKATLKSAYKQDAREPWGEGGKPSHADILLKLTDDFEYFRSGPANDSFVRVQMGDHREVWQVDPKSPRVREILTHRFLLQEDRAPSREALNVAIDTVLAKCGAGPKVDVHIRFARSREAIYLDMCDDQWRAIEVTADGWRVVTDVPVLFRRGAGARPLPLPVKGGTLEALRPLLNCGDDSQWFLMMGWLIGAFLPQGAFCHLVLNGEQGSAKSTTALILQSLIDPSDAGLSGPPKDETDATVSALNAGILAYDNLSGCKAELADTFCRLSTGQGYKTRTFYENLGITIASVKLPVMLNGIDSTVMRGDLLERSIILKLPLVTSKTRLTERGIWADFAGLHPGCLGGLLDAISTGLRNLPHTTLTDPPRMSDFATWVVACEESLPWNPGRFIAAYRGKMEDANRDLAENDSVASALVEWTEQNITQGCGARVTAKDLLIALNDLTGEVPKDFKSWPLSPEALAHKLVRLAPVLRSQGIDMRRLPRTKKSRSRWEIWREGPQPLLFQRFIEHSQGEAA